MILDNGDKMKAHETVINCFKKTKNSFIGSSVFSLFLCVSAGFVSGQPVQNVFRLSAQGGEMFYFAFLRFSHLKH